MTRNTTNIVYIKLTEGNNIKIDADQHIFEPKLYQMMLHKRLYTRTFHEIYSPEPSFSVTPDWPEPYVSLC